MLPAPFLAPLDSGASPALHLLLLSLARDRLTQVPQYCDIQFLTTSQMVDKLWMMFSILAASMEDRPARRSYAPLLLQVLHHPSSPPSLSTLLLQLNLLFLPLLLLLVVLSSLLSAPLLPLFTLPVFFLSFPRPSRSWPGGVGQAAVGPDTHLYRQAARGVAAAVAAAIRTGSLGYITPGSLFLLRHDDRVLWVQVRWRRG